MIDLAQIRAMADAIRAVVGEDDEDLIELIDSETDVLGILRNLAMKDAEAKASEDANKALAKQYADRAKAMSARQDSIRKFIGSVMDALGEKKVALDVATISRPAPRKSVSIYDPDAIPSQMTVTTVKPDAAAIKKALEAGEQIPGAELIDGAPSLMIRR